MAGWSRETWAFIFGISGNAISFMVYLAPLPTFYRIYRKKSTEGFRSEPYVIALFSSMLWIYYALFKADAVLLITINSFGCVIEMVYIVLYLKYAPRSARIYTAKLILLLNVGLFSLTVFLTLVLTKGTKRVVVLGWINMGFALCVFVAPLSIISRVIRTRSVEFMPLPLSIFLTLSAVVWFFYGHFTRDLYVKLPNILGFSFGIIQIALYFFYKGKKKVVVQPAQFEHVVTVATLSPAPGLAVHKVALERKMSDDEMDDEKGDGKVNEEGNGSNRERNGEEVEIELSLV